jgi:hypothetical protein
MVKEASEKMAGQNEALPLAGVAAAHAELDRDSRSPRLAARSGIVVKEITFQEFLKVMKLQGL